MVSQAPIAHRERRAGRQGEGLTHGGHNRRITRSRVLLAVHSHHGTTSVRRAPCVVVELEGGEKAIGQVSVWDPKDKVVPSPVETPWVGVSFVPLVFRGTVGLRIDDRRIASSRIENRSRTGRRSHSHIGRRLAVVRQGTVPWTTFTVPLSGNTWLTPFTTTCIVCASELPSASKTVVST